MSEHFNEPKIRIWFSLPKWIECSHKSSALQDHSFQVWWVWYTLVLQAIETGQILGIVAGIWNSSLILIFLLLDKLFLQKILPRTFSLWLYVKMYKLNNYALFTGPIMIPSKMEKGPNSPNGSPKGTHVGYRPPAPVLRQPIGDEARDLRNLIDHTPVSYFTS